MNPPSGCVFHPRCPYAMDICREQSPPLEQPAASAGDRLASCWLQDGTRPVPQELGQPEPGAAPRPASTPGASAPAASGPAPGTAATSTPVAGAPAAGSAAGQLAPSIAAPDPGSQS